MSKYFWYESEYICYTSFQKALYISLLILPLFHLLCFPDTLSFICLFLLLLLLLAFQYQTSYFILLSAAPSDIHEVPTRSHLHAYTNKKKQNDYSCFFSFSFLVHLALCLFEFVFLYFMFCWQHNGTSRFHGLVSLDDISAIISTPSLGFQVASPTSPIWC